MKLCVITPPHAESQYFSEQVLQNLPSSEVRLIGELYGSHPLNFRPSSQEFAVHHLVDDASVRTERVLLGALPGITFVHDAFLSSHGPEPILNSGYSDVVCMLNGKMKDFPERTKEYSREKFYAVRELSLSLLPIFTDSRMHAQYLSRREHNHEDIAVGSAYLPWPAAVTSKGRTARKSCITATSPFRLGFVGGVQLDFRAHIILRAISMLKDPTIAQLVWLVHGKAERKAAEIFCADWPTVKVEFIEGRTPARWLELLPSLDAAVHLHFSMFHQPGPYLPLSLGAGVPCLVSQECQTWLPAGAAVVIRPGVTELGEVLVALDQFLSQIVKTDVGVDYVREVHAHERVQQELVTLLDAHSDALMHRLHQINDLQSRARAATVAEIKYLDKDASYKPDFRALFTELGWAPK